MYGLNQRRCLLHALVYELKSFALPPEPPTHLIAGLENFGTYKQTENLHSTLDTALDWSLSTIN